MGSGTVFAAPDSDALGDIVGTPCFVLSFFYCLSPLSRPCHMYRSSCRLTGTRTRDRCYCNPTHPLNTEAGWASGAVFCHLVSSISHLAPITTLSASLLLRLLGRDGKGWLDEPLIVVDLEVVAAHELPLALLVGQVAADLVAVLLGLEGGDQVDAGPHLLAGELAAEGIEMVSARMILWLASSPEEHNRDWDRGLDWRGEDGDSPLFPCALAEVVPSVEHHAAADGEQCGGLEASCGQVAL